MKLFVLPLSDPHADIETVGGKGLSLAKMFNAGLPVPDGFHVTTETYRRFVEANDLQTKIQSALKDADPSQPATLEAASASIDKAFTRAAIPDEIAHAIRGSYANLRSQTIHHRPPAGVNRPSSMVSVAVRSSATAEDLPEASFAGQQETYLNIRGEEALLDAVKKCWASLWTARAIAYRLKNDIDQNTVALAVVVQEMVFAEAAGIMFTANPMNGRRDEVVINAAWGLGEAIVGGLVSPDMVVADKATGKVKKMEVAEKTTITVLTECGTEEKLLEGARRQSQVLKEAQVGELVNIAHKIEDFYGSPQDIEWCRTNENFYIVQSRPITALPEAPIEWTPPDPKGIYMRASAADLLPKPVSPLFATLGIPTQVKQMGPLGKRFLGKEAVLAKDYFTTVNAYVYLNAAIGGKSLWWVLTGMLPSYPRLLRRLVPLWRDELHPEYQSFIASKKDLVPAQMSAEELWHEIQELVNAAAYYVAGLMFATMGASAGSEGLLTLTYNKLAKREGDPDANVLLMGWDNIAAHSEKSLYDMAIWARENNELAKYLLETPTANLAAQVSSRMKGEGIGVRDFPEFASRFHTHLEKFGHIVFQLDYAEPLPLDHPEMLLETIRMYLRGGGSNPHERQRASEANRIQTADIMLKRLKGLKRWAFTKTLHWGQSMAEVREDALAEIGLAYPKLRELLRELGNRFAGSGAIRQAEDIFWLEKDEISACVARLEHGQALDILADRVARRKKFNERVGQITPPPMMPMKKRVMGIKTDMFLASTEESQTGNVLKGIPTSTGRVTAPARVLRGPQDFEQMRPGEVLVAGATTPAWTPLFAMASAVVTDIGGPLSHGSIVAREYGIPAVMGTGIATRRIQNGQVITVDGTKGEVILETTGGDQADLAAPPIEWKLPHPKAVLARGSFAEFVPEPISPLFATLAVPIAHKSTMKLMNEIGVTGENNYLFAVLNNYVYVGFVFTPKLTWQMLKASFMLLGPIIKTARQRAIRAREEFLATVQKWQVREPAMLTPSELLGGVREIFTETAAYYNMAQSGTIPTSMIREFGFTRFYNAFVKRRSDPDASSFVFGSENHALRSEKALFDLAMWLKEQPELADYLTRTRADEFCAALQNDSKPVHALKEFSARFDCYLREFGHAIYDLDFAKPTPAEAPEALVETLKVYMAGKNNPYKRQRTALDRSEQATERIIRRLDPLRRKYFIKLLKLAKDTAPLRENSIADMGLGHPQIRRMLGELGRRLVAGGAIACAEDVYWLEAQEVDALAAHLERAVTLNNFSAAVESRKAKWEAMRHIIPPTTLPKASWMTRFFPSNEGAGNTIKGFGASTGKVTARACVMLGPEDFYKMQPGDVIVAGITTPAWTPLFVRASAIVTDIGGPLSHSSIVAREYGIPAVLATGGGTRRIRDGQTITVDGTTGIVTLE